MQDIPMLGYTSPLKRMETETPKKEPDRLIVGFDGLTIDGQPFPWATVDDWVLTIPENGVAYLTVNIVINLPPDPDITSET